MPSILQVKDAYRVLVGECFGEFRFLKNILNDLSNFSDSFGGEHECPACPKVYFNLFRYWAIFIVKLYFITKQFGLIKSIVLKAPVASFFWTLLYPLFKSFKLYKLYSVKW